MKAPRKQTFTKTFNNLVKAIDVDDSLGRSVPINMNFVETGYISKDSGSSILGASESNLCHSEFLFKKKDGTSYRIRACGTFLQKLNTSTNTWSNLETGTFTISIAATAVVTLNNHGLQGGSKVIFTTTGTLPTGVSANTIYYVLSSGLTNNTFHFSLTDGGVAVGTSGTQSGIHTLYRQYTSGEEFAYQVYLDELYFGNSYENFSKWTGTQFTEYSSLPKGNVYEIFEDRLHVAGIRTNPLAILYSDVGVFTTFGATSIITPLGTDSVKALESYFGVLMIFKENTIWKLTYNFDEVVSLYIPKLEIQSANYGACSRKAVTWVENDIWFFTGTEVRAIGFRDNQTGQFGINKVVISDSIKDTLKTLSRSKYSLVTTFYHDRRYYLAIALTTDNTNNTLFVCHTLHSNSWTKYIDRPKAYVNGFIQVDGVIYSNMSYNIYGTLKWDSVLTADMGSAIVSEVFFAKTENAEFNQSNLYRYCDLLFKDLQGVVKATIRQDLHNVRSIRQNVFYVGSSVEGEINSLGEVTTGQYLVADSFGENVSNTPFLRKKLSFLIKAQSIILGLSNTSATEKFTIAEYSFTGFREPERYFDKTQITNLN